ncbi:hypothetical protein [Paludibacterium denitrificans]|uniref:hypothetical protein n=1 Tax=Paludibacterium denitrificans TaxID=2675226 RepID=UPI001E33BFA5|nr:hypothetical protein [Paludibacterium denitrificans]
MTSPCCWMPRWLKHRHGGVAVSGLPASHRAGLIRLLPQYESPWGILHAAFLTRRGLSPAVRAFIDFLVQELVLKPITRPIRNRIFGQPCQPERRRVGVNPATAETASASG